MYHIRITVECCNQHRCRRIYGDTNQFCNGDGAEDTELRTFLCSIILLCPKILSHKGSYRHSKAGHRQEGKAGVKEAPKVYEDIIMTLVEPTSKTVLGMGHTIDIKLRAGSNLKWNFDKEYKSLEFISERTEDGFVHAVFKAKEPGRETVYFDCLDVGDPLNVKVLETKLISVKVE